MYLLADKRIWLIIIRSILIVLSFIAIAMVLKGNAPYLKPDKLEPDNKPGHYIVFLREEQKQMNS